MTSIRKHTNCELNSYEAILAVFSKPWLLTWNTVLAHLNTLKHSPVLGTIIPVLVMKVKRKKASFYHFLRYPMNIDGDLSTRPHWLYFYPQNKHGTTFNEFTSTDKVMVPGISQNHYRLLDLSWISVFFEPQINGFKWQPFSQLRIGLRNLLDLAKSMFMSVIKLFLEINIHCQVQRNRFLKKIILPEIHLSPVLKLIQGQNIFQL